MSQPEHSPAQSAAACAVARPTAMGIDIGGTKIYASAIGTDNGSQEPVGELLHEPTPTQGDAFIDTLVGMVRRVRDGCPVSAVGIATAGVVDSINGQILGSTGNLPALRNIANLRERLQAQVSLPIHIENDANAAAYGEFRAGAAKGTRNAIAITLGTGVGMGIIIDGKMYRGANFFAGEGGHIALSPRHERMCTCGRWDCWEAFASGKGLAITIRQMLEDADPTTLEEFLKEGQSIESVTTYDLIDAWRQENKLALRIMDLWHEHIALGLGSLMNVLDPEVAVVGGGLAQFVNFERLRLLTRQRTMKPDVQIEPATLGNLAGIVGAAYLALDNLAPQA